MAAPLIGWDIFDFSSETAEQNSTKHGRNQDLKVLYKVCNFRADRKNKMAAPASGWLIKFWLLLWNWWTEFNETWQESRSWCPLPSLCLSDQLNPARPPINWDIFEFSCPLHSFQRVQWPWVARKLNPHWISKYEVEKAMTEYHIVTKICTEGKHQTCTCKTKSHLR